MSQNIVRFAACKNMSQNIEEVLLFCVHYLLENGRVEWRLECLPTVPKTTDRDLSRTTIAVHAAANEDPVETIER